MIEVFSLLISIHLFLHKILTFIDFENYLDIILFVFLKLGLPTIIGNGELAEIGQNWPFLVIKKTKK